MTVVIGRGKPIGITNAAGVSIGLEGLCAANFMDPDIEDRFVHTIAHEYGHIQQPRADQTDVPGAMVLFASLIEGGAEFIAELISDGVAAHQLKSLTKAHEAAIETASAGPQLPEIQRLRRTIGSSRFEILTYFDFTAPSS